MSKQYMYLRHPIFKQVPFRTPAEGLSILRDVLDGKQSTNVLIEALVAIAGKYVTFFASSYSISDRQFIDEWVSKLCLKLTKLGNNRDILERISAYPKPSLSFTVAMNVRSTLYDCFSENKRGQIFTPLSDLQLGQDDVSLEEIDMADLLDQLVTVGTSSKLTRDMSVKLCKAITDAMGAGTVSERRARLQRVYDIYKDNRKGEL